MRLLAPLVLVIAALAVVVWLDDTSSEADLVFVNQNEVFTLDPQRMSYLQDLRLAHVLYEGLVRWNNETFEILPAAAELPRISGDGLTYTFRIRADARWATGEPLTAHDFIYSWKRAILPDTAADYSNLFFTIDGAEPFFTWRLAQTRAFTADPYAAGGASPEASGVLQMVNRLDRLLAADAPAGIASPEPFGGAGIIEELSRLRTAAEADSPALGLELEAAANVRAWFDALDESPSRAAESLWSWKEAEQRFSTEVGLVALDDRTLEVRLARPTAYFTDLLCFGIFFPVHRPTVEGWSDDFVIPTGGWHTVSTPPFAECRWVSLSPNTGKFEQKHGWARPERHVGNGTHRLVQWRYKRDLRLEPNPRFHDPERVKSATILALTIEDTNTAVLAFESGRVDWLAEVSAEYQADMIEERLAYEQRYADQILALRGRGLTEDEILERLPSPEKGERRDIHVFPTFGTDFFSFNCREMMSNGRPNPFADPAVRRAFTLSIDKRTIVERVTRLNEPVADTLIPPGSIPGYRSPEGLPYDPVRARRELQKAGWSDRDQDGMVEDADGRPFPIIDLLYTTNTPRYKWMSLELKEQWERALGVRVELRGQETKFYKEDLKQGKFMIARGVWYGDYGDPTTFLDLCKSTDGNNDRAYANAAVDAMLAEAAREPDASKRLRILEECERYLMQDEVPMAPICQRVQVYMYEPGRVTGLSKHPRLTQFLWQIGVRQP